MNKRNIGNLIELSSDNGFIHKIGTDTYFKKGIITDSIDNYEEVSEIPPYTKAEYDKKVAELVRERYTESEEFAIQRKAINTILSPTTFSESNSEQNMAEYSYYNIYVNECKEKAKNPDLYIKEGETKDTDQDVNEDEAKYKASEPFTDIESQNNADVFAKTI